MAIRVENTNAIMFGTFVNTTTITEASAELADGTVIVQKPIVIQRTVPANTAVEFVTREVDFLFPQGDAMDSWLLSVVTRAFDAPITVRLYQGAGLTLQELTVSGYAAQTVSDWTITTEAG